MQGNDEDSEPDFKLFERTLGINIDTKKITPLETTNKLSERESLENIFTSIFRTQEFINLIKSKSKNRELTSLKLQFINQSLINKYSQKKYHNT